MTRKFWDDEENPSQWQQVQEGILDSNENMPENPVVQYEDISEDAVETIEDESAFELDNEEVATVFNVRIRLEQARLYDMLINHDLFDGVQADKQAIKNVQTELKEYIVERLEILMGIRQDPRKAPKPLIMTSNDVIMELPFNDVEIEFLKDLSYKGTKGESAHGQIMTISSTASTGLKPILNQPKLNTLKSMTRYEKVQKDELPIEEVVLPTKEVEKQPVKASRPVVAKKVTTQTKPPVKVKNNPEKDTAHNLIRSHGTGVRKLTPSEIDALAREDLKKTEGKKELHLMSAKEKAQEVKRINEQYKNTIIDAPGRKPMMGPDQLNAHFTTQAAISSARGTTSQKFNQLLASVLVNKKSR